MLCCGVMCVEEASSRLALVAKSRERRNHRQPAVTPRVCHRRPLRQRVYRPCGNLALPYAASSIIWARLRIKAAHHQRHVAREARRAAMPQPWHGEVIRRRRPRRASRRSNNDNSMALRCGDQNQFYLLSCVARKSCATLEKKGKCAARVRRRARRLL